MEEVEKLHPAQPEEEPEEEGPVIDIEAKPEIAYDDFMKMQFQVGEIIKCEEVPKSKKASLLSGEDRKPGTPDCFWY